MLDPQSPFVAIIPGFNEAQTIGPVIRTIYDSGLFRDVIAVLDGSTDQSPSIAKSSGANVILHSPKRQGKGMAMRQGARQSTAPWLFFFDADLLGLTSDHIHALIEPIKNDELDMVVGLRDRGSFLTWLEQYLPLIGGERIVRREIFEAVPDRFLQGYRVETALNMYCRSKGLRVGTRPLLELHIRRKMQKLGFWKGAQAYLKMTYEMLDAWWLVRKAMKKIDKTTKT